jgi:hypothetical protein
LPKRVPLAEYKFRVSLLSLGHDYKKWRRRC